MKVDVLINQLDKHNDSNILTTQNLKPKKVIFIYDEREMYLLQNLKAYYEENFNSIIFESIKINEGDFKLIRDLIINYKDKETIVNLTSGRKLNSLALLIFSRENKIKSIFIDIKDRNSYILSNDIESIKLNFEDMELNDIVESFGGEILEDSSNLINKEDLKYLTKQIYKNLTLWHKYKQKLYDSNVFNHDYEDSTKVTINTNFLEKEEKNLLNKILIELEELNGINYIRNKDGLINVNFNNRHLKSFIFKSGTWLEVATNIMISEIKEIDEVKSGVVFLWNNKNKELRNEVDVLAIKDSIIICISCKDSNKYDEDALNELDVYAKQIGGEKVYKIIVATKEPLKTCLISRAKEMGINIVIFDGDENKFKDTIRNIISLKS